MFPNDDLAQPFMGESVGMKKIVIEKMTKRTVPDVMNQGRHPQEFFNKICRRDIFDGFLEEWIQMSGESSRHVHRSERMHESCMFRRGIDPAGTL